MTLQPSSALERSCEQEPPPPAAPEVPEPAPRRNRAKRLGFFLATAIALLLASGEAVLAVAHLYLNSPESLGRLRAVIERTVQGRIGGREVRIGPNLAVGWFGRVELGPLELEGRPGKGPVARAERALIWPRWPALLAGRVEPGTILLDGVRIDAGEQGAELRALVEGRHRRSPTPSGEAPGREPPVVRFRGLVLRIGTGSSHHQSPVELGPVDGHASLSRAEGEQRLFLQTRFPTGGFAEAVVAWGGDRPRLRARLEKIATSDLPRAVREALPFEVTGGSISASISTTEAAGPGSGAARFEAVLQDLTVRSEELSDEPVGPVRAGAAGQVHWNTRSRSLSVQGGELWIGRDRRQSVATAFSVQAKLRPEPWFDLRVDAKQLDYGRLLQALPPALVPAQDLAWLEGTLSARFTVAGPIGRPAAWQLEADLDSSDLRPPAQGGGMAFLGKSFEYQPGEADWNGRWIRVGPENPRYVPLRQLPSYVVRAVTTSEDAGFYGHHGFDFAELRNAFAERMTEGRVRGASTITQQLAKNLFLSRERTLARKAREALLTVALESSFSKSRLLEIYLNIAEWGPGIHGIGEAARHYFGKDARALTPKEAAFLATIIPNPVRYHVYYTRGELSAHWNDRVRDLLVKMRAAGQLSDPEFLDALEEPLVFARG